MAHFTRQGNNTLETCLFPILLLYGKILQYVTLLCGHRLPRY